jgi:6,7-dimethyl-8-ribityllumazine synthase
MQLDDKQEHKIDGSGLKISIILPYFNESLGLELMENAREELLNQGVKEENIKLHRVAGSLELPYACQKVIKSENPDAIIALAVIIRGETTHYELVTETTHQGLMKVQLKHETPISFGLLACENLKQAEERVSKKGLNKGKDAAIAALIQTQL